MRKFYLTIALMLSYSAYSQAPFPHINTSNFNAERVASFGVLDAPQDFLEITNSSQFDTQFIPSIWAHQQSDNRFVLRHFATTNSSQDSGDTPMMIFRAEIRNSLNLIAPQNASFPWGISGSNVSNRPLFGWENGNTQLMRILANGFVGIGTTNPTAQFHTTAAVRFENLQDAVTPFKILGTNSSGYVYEYNPAELVGGTTASDADWLKPDGTFPNSIDDTIYTNGNVGINVQNPTANFNTSGTLKFENLTDSTNPFKILGTDNSGNVFEYNPAEISGGVGTVNDFDWLKPDGTFPSSIDDTIYTNGNVGINVQNPTANFNTHGTLKFENLADSTNPFKILGTDTNGNVFEYNPAELSAAGTIGHFDWLKPDGSEPNAITDNIYTNGKVGINTKTFPTNVGNVNVSKYSLFAKGGILTEEVRVSLSSDWADFVFLEDYKLESLEKVEKYISENKHLKDVPSAEEVKQKGIELGEMNKILLMKIEELTLYVIEINKKLELQNAEIVKLQSK